MIVDRYYHKNQSVSVELISLWGILCIIISFGLFLVLGSNDYLYGFFCMGIASTLIVFQTRKRAVVNMEIFLATIFRFGICIMYTVMGDGDADYYGVNAAIYANMPLNELFTNIPTGSYLYSWVISFFFRFFGEYYMPVRVFNATLSIICVLFVYDITCAIYRDATIAKKATLIAAIFPNLIRFSSLFANREVLLIFFMLLYIKKSFDYYHGGNSGNLIASIIYLIPTMILHTSMLSMISLTLMIIMLKKNMYESFAAKMLKKQMLMIGAVVVFTYMLTSGIGTEKLGIGGTALNIESVSKLGNMSAAGRAAYLTNANFTNPILILLFLPIRMLYFLFTPFPWMVRNALDIFGLFDAILYLWVGVSSTKKMVGIVKETQRKEENTFLSCLFVALLIIIMMFSMVTSNYGTAIRHRCKLFLIFLIIAADVLKYPLKKGVEKDE